VKRPANIRLLTVALGLAAAGLASPLLVTAGDGAESLLASPPVHAAPADQGRILVAQAAAAPADKPVSYTDAQAASGETRFKSVCSDCHGDDLRGGMNGGPPLRGQAFDQTFGNGAPASALFGFMSTQMPPDSPGQYSAAQYAEMMAYILKLNGYQAGAELPSDTDALDHLLMQK
jgi:mono/diheme cytochrome c family protein